MTESSRQHLKRVGIAYIAVMTMLMLFVLTLARCTGGFGTDG